MKSKQLTNVIVFVLAFLLLTTSCTRIGEDLDPASLGYEIEVTYNALGGIINQREIRNTNYAKNSLLFEPRGSSNLLVAPLKTGYTLAGWYTDVKEIPGKDGEEPTYEFDAQDRWDFKVDRVQENTTLYARWVNQAKAQYIDSETGEIIFSKDITASSPLSALSPAILNLVAKNGYTFLGYFDENLEQEIVFSDYEYSPLMPTDQVLYDMLAEEFPDNFLPYDGEAEVITETETEQVDTEGEVDPEAEVIPEANLEEIDPYVFLHQYGYQLEADDETLAAIRYRKNEIIDEYINKYIENNQHNDVYLKFEEGVKVHVAETADLSKGGTYMFDDLGDKGEYFIENDLNFGDANFAKSDHFSSTINGNNHVLSNIHVKVTLKKKDILEGTIAGLFGTLENATIKDVTFKDMVIEVSAPNGADVEIGALAVNGINSTIQNVTFDGLTIVTDVDKSETYRVSDFILNSENMKVENVTGNNVAIEVSDAAEVNRTFN